MTYIQNIKSRLLSISQKFPLVDARLNQIQGVHLKFIFFSRLKKTIKMKFTIKETCNKKIESLFFRGRNCVGVKKIELLI